MTLSRTKFYERSTFQTDVAGSESPVKPGDRPSTLGISRDLRFGSNDHLEVCPSCGAAVQLTIGRSGPTFYSCRACRAVGAYFKTGR
jgi:hypothetical protein